MTTSGLENEIANYKPLAEPRLTYEEFLLALCVWREGRSESFEGKQNIAQVIRNRAADKRRWPNSIISVILQKKQFSSFNYNDMQVQKFPALNDHSWEECIRAITPVSEIEAYGATHYHTLNVNPPWDIEPKWRKVIGNHVFLKL